MKTRLACIPSFLSIALHLFKCLQGREEQVRERGRENESWRRPGNNHWRGFDVCKTVWKVNKSLYSYSPSSVIHLIVPSSCLPMLIVPVDVRCVSISTYTGCPLPVPPSPAVQVDPKPPFCGAFVCTVCFGETMGCNGCNQGLDFCSAGVWGAGTSCEIHEGTWVCQMCAHVHVQC